MAGRKIIFELISDSNGVRRIERAETEEEANNRIAEAESNAIREKSRQEQAEPLMCDICGEEVCMAYASDLEGSRFYHSNCLNKNK